MNGNYDMFTKANKDKPFFAKKQSSLSNTTQVGNLAEKVALDFLINKGLCLLHRQFRCSMGECDLIMKEGKVIVFVEVRYKQNTSFCTPEETIHRSKQRKLIRTAEFFLQHYPESDCRMDVISISGKQPNFNIAWIPDAFGVEWCAKA